MLIRQLEYLVTLAREKHFARAAERVSGTRDSRPGTSG
jgi:DNA-binding transcriptional LysR family regulator